MLILPVLRMRPMLWLWAVVLPVYPLPFALNSLPLQMAVANWEFVSSRRRRKLVVTRFRGPSSSQPHSLNLSPTGRRRAPLWTLPSRRTCFPSSPQPHLASHFPSLHGSLFTITATTLSGWVIWCDGWVSRQKGSAWNYTPVMPQRKSSSTTRKREQWEESRLTMWELRKMDPQRWDCLGDLQWILL